MPSPRASVVQFVNAVARVELEQQEAVGDFDVAQRMLTRLHDALGKLVGGAGFQVLLARAIVLAARETPALGGIRAGANGVLEGTYTTGDRVALQADALTIVAHFLELLAVLIGEDLAMRLVGEVWSLKEEKKR